MTALDVTDSHPDRLTVDVTCLASDQEHSAALTDALSSVDEVAIHKVSDRTVLLHLGGKIEVRSKFPLLEQDPRRSIGRQPAAPTGAWLQIGRAHV